MQKTPKIYISYSWSEQELLIADTIDQDWQSVGIRLIRDKRDVSYKNSLKSFMRSMLEGDFVLAIIGEGYLRSKNCMFEALELFQHPDFKDKILPIIVPNAGIYNALGKTKYIKYWEEKISELNQEIKMLDNLSNIRSISEELDHFTRIRNSFSEFVGILSDMRTVSWPEIRQQQYAEIFEHIGFSTEDTGVKAKCLQILDIEDKEEKELKLYELLAKYPKNYTVLFSLVSTLRQAGEFKKAKNHLVELMKIYKEEWITYFLLGYIEMNIGNYTEALQALNKALLIKPDSFKTNYTIAQCYNHLDDAINMRKFMERALEIEPNSSNSAGVLNELALLLKEHFDDFNGAYSLLERAIKIKPEDDQLYYNLGSLMLESGDAMNYIKAKENFEHALAINPEQVPALLHLGYLFHIHFEDYGKALEYMISSLVYEPSNHITHMNISAIYRLDPAFHKEAIFHIQQAERLAPDNYSIHISFALLMMKHIKDYPIARAQLEKAIEIEPENPKAHFNLAMLLSPIGPLRDENLARKHYQKACEYSSEYNTPQNHKLFGPI